MATQTSRTNLHRTASRLLRKAGYTSWGRRLREANREQRAFERRLILVPAGGLPPKR